MAEDKRPVGRPRTTVADLPEDWLAIIKECGEQGGSYVECRHALGIGDSAWETLQADSPEFRQAVKNAKAASNAWWERLGRKLAMEGGGNSAVWIFNMKNRFGWRDQKPDSEQDEAPPESVSVNVKDGRKPDA